MKSNYQLEKVNASLWTWFLRNLLLPGGDIFFGQQMMQRLQNLEQAQWWSVEQLQKERLKSLKFLIQTAYREVPRYRTWMDMNGINPTQVDSVETLKLLPIATKDWLRKGYPNENCRETGQKTYEACTSGSTGKNFCVLEDAQTAGWYRASFMLALEWAGWKIGERHLQTGMTLNRSLDRKLKDLILRCQYVSAYALTDNDLTRTLDILEKKKIGYLWGYPGSLYLLAKHARLNGWNLPLVSAVTWGDMLYSHYRREIETAFQTSVFDTYGCAEGIQISAQCEHSSYHIHALDTIVEFLDDNGQSVSPGTPANVVVTRLHPGPMPLIRYKLGDIGIESQISSCACGRCFPLMQGIQGRDTDIIVTPSGNRLIVHFFTGILEHFRNIDSFQVVQESIDRIHLYLVPMANSEKIDKKQVILALQEKGAWELIIEIEIVENIPLHRSGKHKFIISNL